MILRRVDGSRFSAVAPLWKGLTAVVIGGGASLTAEQFEAVGRARHTATIRVVAVNDAYLLAPWADVIYAADSHWFKWHTAGIAKPLLGLSAEAVAHRWATFAGQKCTIQSSGGNVTDEAVHMMRNRDFPNHGQGLSLDPHFLVTGRNSGFQALNLAVLAGAKRIILIGFDGAPAKDGKEHFHGGHPRPTPREAYPLYRQAMSAAESLLIDAGVQVLNASPGTQIDSFPKVRLEDVL